MKTATTPVQLSMYRERHRIESVRAWDDLLDRPADFCKHDGIRLYAQRGRWVHDRWVIKELAALERGEGVRW